MFKIYNPIRAAPFLKNHFRKTYLRRKVKKKSSKTIFSNPLLWVGDKFARVDLIAQRHFCMG